jgi:hypothetical protein
MNDETRFSEWTISRRLGSPMLNNNYIGYFCCRIVRMLYKCFSSISKRANLILSMSGGPLQTRTMKNDETKFSEWAIRRSGSPMLNNIY